MFGISFEILCAGMGLALFQIYKWATQNDNFFLKKGVQALKPALFIGNSRKYFLKKVELKEFVEKLYNDFPDQKISGFFNFMRPIYFLRDPELYKQIAIKEFDSFEDHQFMVEPAMDKLLGNTVFSMRGEKWRNMRTTLSPAFTSSKIRHMFTLVRKCAEASCNYLLETKLPTVGCECELEIADFYLRLANDVIASCAFGLQINSLKDRKNQFFETGRRLQYLSSLNSFLKIWCLRAFPWLTKHLKFEFIDSDIHKIFFELVMHNIETRRLNKIIRPDLIDLLMRAQRKNKPNHKVEQIEGPIWSDQEIVSQAFAFFLAGLDTTMWVLVATTYELAQNPAIQQRLIEEVDSTIQGSDDENISYEDLNKMKYLDMVINEVLRVHAPGIIIDRLCTKKFFLTDGEKVNVNIEKGDQIWVPIHCFHHNPNYFPNPEVFDPERFNDENKANISPAHYAPFGIGPRACIGTRFALIEIKAIVYYMLGKFSFHVSPQTEIPMKVKSSLFGLNPVNGLRLVLKRRK